MSEKKWIVQSKGTYDADVLKLAEDAKISPIVARVLINRGLTDSDSARSFLLKSKSAVHHPFEMKNAEKAAKRIADAVSGGEKIVVYGDYDVDGITATAMMYKFLKSLGADVSYYIPNRSDEGYGINMLALSKLQKEGNSLMITVDCGITAVGEVEFAKTIGLEIIVTDHHTCKEDIPKAYAVVNPKQPGCTYPFKELAGVGVAFKLILAIAVTMGLPSRKYYDEFIDIVSIGTIADVVPLTDENRLFVSDGLRSLRCTKNKGLLALFKLIGIESKPISTGTVSFSIAPRINAAGRIGTASNAVSLLITDDDNTAEELAQYLETENKLRQNTEQEILKDATEIIENMPDIDKKSVFVLAKEGWHHGVIGIVASRIVDKYHKPAILISLSGNVGKGSGRSVKGYNLFEALSASTDLLLKFGGHELAAGLGVSGDCIDALDKALNDYAKVHMSPDANVATLNIDSELSASDISYKNATDLAVLEPYGMGNPQPIFSVTNASLVSARTLSTDKHCKLAVTKNGKQFEFIGFGMGALAEKFVIGDKIDIAFTMDANIFRGEHQLQLIIKDVRFSIKQSR